MFSNRVHARVGNIARLIGARFPPLAFFKHTDVGIPAAYNAVSNPSVKRLFKKGIARCKILSSPTIPRLVLYSFDHWVHDSFQRLPPQIPMLEDEWRN